MTALTFLIPGDPRGKGRPRAAKRGKGIVLYTDDKTASYENLVALAARRALEGRGAFSEPVAVYMRAQVKVPESTSQKKRTAMLAGEIEPGKKPDLDNILKAVLDGCNTIAFVDDALVTSIRAVKVYSTEPGVYVDIRPAKEA